MSDYFKREGLEMKPKSILTAGLLLFVAVSVGVVIGKGTRSPAGPDGVASSPVNGPGAMRQAPRVIAYYFHGEVRCLTCRTIEAYAREAIDTHFADALKSGRLEVRYVDFDQPGNEHFLDDYQLSSSSLVLVDSRGSGSDSWKQLQDVWQLTDDKPAFIGYVKEELAKFLESHGG
jgi:hypothetical protein